MQNITTLGEVGYKLVGKTEATRTYRREGDGWMKFINFQQDDGRWYMFGTFTERDQHLGWIGKALRMSTDEANAVAYTLRCLERGGTAVLD